MTKFTYLVGAIAAIGIVLAPGHTGSSYTTHTESYEAHTVKTKPAVKHKEKPAPKHYVSVDGQYLIDSYNRAHLSWPYKSQNLLLSFRNKKRTGKDVFIYTYGKSQIIGNYIKVKFDNGKWIRYNTSDAADFSSNIKFINATRGFVRRASKAKKISIKATFYQDGTQTLVFDASDFSGWESVK